ncbi:MAG: phage tail protein [Actinomycetota bacterium]|nr:phage tail protein [Actinomycetota bacterium]
MDNGATWQEATNGRPIPRLPVGKTVARTVMTRTTLTRPTGSSPSPRVHRLEVRITVDASRVELVQLGRFLINECSISDSPGGLTIDIAGADLSRKVQRNRWERTYAYAKGIRTTDVIKMMIRSRFPACVFNFVSTNDVVPTLFFGEQATNDPWDDAQKLARDIGCDLFFDAYGVCTLRSTPDPAVDESSFTFDDTFHPTITELVRRITDEDTYNYVVVTGESSGNIRPVRAAAADRDPASPTYVLGPYGIVTYRVASASIVSGWQAMKAAQALLLKMKGATETVDFSAVPMPACEPGDVITVTRGRSKVEGQFTLQAIRMPLGASEEMRATCRRQRY